MAKKTKGPGKSAKKSAARPGDTSKEAALPTTAKNEAAEPTEPKAGPDAEPAADEPDANEPDANEPDADEPDADEPDADEPEADEPEAAAPKKTPAAPPAPATEKPIGAAWALPLVKLDRAWTWFEARLLVVVLLTLVFAMVTWISLKGMALPLESDSKAGMAFRVLFGIAVAGGLAQLFTRKMDATRRASVTTAAILAGAAFAPLWRSKGVEYSEHILNWLQEGSSVTMLGGLRGVSTRLTILLALIGASLAAASGKHINIDVVLRFLNPKVRRVVFVFSTLATLTVCVSAAWGFFDYISIESFGAKKDASAGEKIDEVEHEVGQDLFVWRKQLGLDASAFFHVLGGGKWDDDGRMTAGKWNEMVNEGGYREHFTKEECDQILAPADAPNDSRIAMVIVPGGTPRGLLMHTMDLLWCWGLVTIGLRFVLRMLLVVSGHASTDPEPDEFEGVIGSDDEVEAEAEAVAHPNEKEAA